MQRNVAITEAGALGVLYLKRYWRKRLDILESRGRQVDRAGKQNTEQNLDYILLHGLGLGIVEPDRFIFHERPSFEQFERWVLDTLGGTLAPAAVDRVNGAIRRCLEQPRHAYPLAAAIADPVLSAEDLTSWDENGYVILRNAVCAEDARAAELAVWEFLGMDPQHPDTWYGGAHNFWTPLYRHPALDKNRQSKRIRKAFAQVWGTEDLLATIDRASLNVPVRGDGVDRSGPSALHWDASIAQPMPFGVQGILYLTDTTAEQGAFQCVPGFHHRLGNWLEGLAPGEAPRTAALTLEAVPVAAKAGDLIICATRCPTAAAGTSVAIRGWRSTSPCVRRISRTTPFGNNPRERMQRRLNRRGGARPCRSNPR